jgi:hypothetical protein
MQFPYSKSAADAFRAYNKRIQFNVKRVIELVIHAHRGADPDTGQEILRAAVVLNHAYLEDLLRTSAGILLPTMGEAALNEIPLAGLSSRRPEKFHLGKLAQHRGKTVDELIHQSVADHLEYSTFNSVDDIVRLLTTLGLDKTKYEPHFPHLKQMIERRHLIVHRGDLEPTQTSTAPTLRRIETDQVLDWQQATLDFASRLNDDLFRIIIAARSKAAENGVDETELPS